MAVSSYGEFSQTDLHTVIALHKPRQGLIYNSYRGSLTRQKITPKRSKIPCTHIHMCTIFKYMLQTLEVPDSFRRLAVAVLVAKAQQSRANST